MGQKQQSKPGEKTSGKTHPLIPSLAATLKADGREVTAEAISQMEKEAVELHIRSQLQAPPAPSTDEVPPGAAAKEAPPPSVAPEWLVEGLRVLAAWGDSRLPACLSPPGPNSWGACERVHEVLTTVVINNADGCFFAEVMALSHSHVDVQWSDGSSSAGVPLTDVFPPPGPRPTHGPTTGAQAASSVFLHLPGPNDRQATDPPPPPLPLSLQIGDMVLVGWGSPSGIIYDAARVIRVGPRNIDVQWESDGTQACDVSYLPSPRAMENGTAGKRKDP
eukprot:gene5637-2895_t